MHFPIDDGESPELTENNLWSEHLSDEELTHLALEGDPWIEPGEGAIPVDLAYGHLPSSLSAWYMPAVSSRRIVGWRRPVVLTIIATLVVLEALGLCSVFGQVVVG